MRAIAFQEYGDSSRLDLMDLPDPKVGPDTVLIRVKAAGVNPVDWKAREGHLEAPSTSTSPSCRAGTRPVSSSRSVPR
ncbi:MAG: alcohol dehydrogenase catalytic domain-containing protein [Nocardioidaceae bacterium]